MHEQTVHITLTEAAKLAPGRPSTNCLWRWCRRGVLSRCGERVRLQHMRIGGKIFTTAAWVEEFGRRLAEADAAYFDLQQPVSAAPATSAESPAGVVVRRRRRRAVSSRRPQRPSLHEQTVRALEEEGL